MGIQFNRAWARIGCNLLVLAFVGGLALFPAPPATALPGAPGKDQTKAALLRLEQAPTANERAQAALAIAGSPAAVDNQTMTVLIVALYSDRDALVRATVARSMGEIAVKQMKGVEPGQLEPAMVEALSTAYGRETDARVRRSIIFAAGQLNHGNANKLLEKALSDSDLNVRAVAQRAKLLREQRLIKFSTG